MRCSYEAVCPFFKKKSNNIDEATYSKYTAQYCSSQFDNCAVYSIIEEANFLAVPPDLLPDQKHRIYVILSNSEYA